MIRSILIANRGEIACRIIQTCRRLGIRSVAVFSEADVQARHVLLADEALFIGPSPAAQSYLSIENILTAAQCAAVDAIHPGFGFLAENAGFARACETAGFIFIGPPADAIETMGDKRTARVLVENVGLPFIPGYSGNDQADQKLLQEAQTIGFPILVKAAAGGGGKGMRLVQEAAQLPEALASARNEAQNAFGSRELLIEKALPTPRHIEIQIFADRHGNVIHLGERECSVQRRFQKVIEETPSPALTPALREQMGATAVTIARAVNYQNAGTVEFLLDDNDRFYFLEMNTRLQVEHPITEMVTGIDLVDWQIRIAEGETLPMSQDDVSINGHAIEARIYAENPERDFLPVTGDILLWQEPSGEGIRVESGLQAQDHVSVHYDPMLAKIIAFGPDRKTAVRRLIRALEKTVLLGLTTNLPFLIDLLTHNDFQSGSYNTQIIPNHFSNWRSRQDDNSPALMAVTLAQYQHYFQNNQYQGYWRNNPNHPQRFLFALEGSEQPIEVHLTPQPHTNNQFHVTFANKPDQNYALDLHAYDGRAMDLTIAGHRQQIVLAAAEDLWWVQTRQGAVKLQALPLLPRSQLSAGTAGSLRAPMPGSILAVLVDEGQEVEEGQALMKLEAMKMEHTIRTAAGGLVEAIYYAVGDTVEADAELLRIVESST